MDEEKVRWAKCIISAKEVTLYTEFSSYEQCPFCHEESRRAVDVEHDEECVVIQAEAYLESVKGD